MCDEKLIEEFKSRFGQAPAFIVRCPGRVNLIGEHIDYSGYGVLPMAVEQSVRAAVLPVEGGTELCLENTSPNYAAYTGAKGEFPIDKSKPLWHHYFLCGYRGMLEHLGKGENVPNGMKVLLEGSIPPGAGLSSSSALVCCAAVATLKAQTGKDFDLMSKNEVAEMCAKCERYIGTEGGGMDQAISMLAEAGTAKKIDFNPLRSCDVKLPKQAAFFVLHSCVSVNKAAGSLYNERVVECRLAAQVKSGDFQLIAKIKGIEQWANVRKLGELQQALGSPSLAEMESIVNATLKKEPYTKEELLESLGVADDQLATLSLSANTLHMTSFKLHDRALHVFSEANRVLKFADACSAAGEGEGALKQLGDLMNASHDSCSNSYECSCAELDELVAACKKSGASGARLTGAGWGGCVVALVDADKADHFDAEIKSAFYDKLPHRRECKNRAVSLSRPAAGASVRCLSDH